MKVLIDRTTSNIGIIGVGKRCNRIFLLIKTIPGIPDLEIKIEAQ